MVSFIWAGIAASLGLLVYLLIPVLGFLYPVEIRQQVGTFYLKLAGRCFKQFSFVRRILSGYDVKVIEVDDEQKQLKVTLSSSLVGEDNEYQFNDPDNRILRLWNKPVSLNFEKVPAATDAELSEMGYYVREHEQNEGLTKHENDEDRETQVDPFIRASNETRLVDPIDTFELVPNGIDPENIKTAEKKTKQRFEKYGSNIGMAETVGTLMGFVVGVAGVAGLQYVKQNIIEQSSSGAPEPPDVGLPNFIVPDLSPVIDLLLVMV